MSPQPARNDPVDCVGCARPNDVDRGGTQCVWCQTPLPAPWGGDYLINNPPEGGKK